MAVWCEPELWHAIPRSIVSSEVTMMIVVRSKAKVSSVVALMAECQEP